MLRSIMECQYEFVSPEWDDISEGPKELVGFNCSMCFVVYVPYMYLLDTSAACVGSIRTTDSH